MLPVILIIIGIILSIVGIIGLLSVSVQPLLKAFRIVYTQDWEDYWYEHGKGQNALQHGRRVLVTMYLIILAIGLALTISGLVIQYMPRGNDTVISAGNVGATAGEGDEWTDISGIGTGNVQAEYVIRISGDTIYVNGQAFETVEFFEEALKTMDRTKNVTLVDDFAVSSTYHQVKELVNRYGLICGESAE